MSVCSSVTCELQAAMAWLRVRHHLCAVQALKEMQEALDSTEVWPAN